jgi:hypothetical protein
VSSLLVREDQCTESAGVGLVGHVERVQIDTPPLCDARRLVG